MELLPQSIEYYWHELSSDPAFYAIIAFALTATAIGIYFIRKSFRLEREVKPHNDLRNDGYHENAGDWMNN